MAAARRLSDRARRAEPSDREDRAQRSAGSATRSELERAAMIETALQQAIRQGAFDDLPGAGKPIPGLGDHQDPDWWIRRKIETEQLHGLGPAALTLRVENLDLPERLDALSAEREVREVLEDFNTRVIEARRQLLGGPPVVTPTRDIDAEVTAWQDRRAQRQRQQRAAQEGERAAQEGERGGGRNRRPQRWHLFRR